MCNCLGETIEMEELFSFLYRRFSQASHGAAVDSLLISTPSSASTHLYMIIR